MKNGTKLLLKIFFAIGIIYWLLQSGKLDFSLIPQAFANKASWPWAILLLIIQDIVSAIRWKMILEICSHKRLPFMDILRTTWIGLFFNSFLPGAITGDFIKLIYARDINPNLTKSYLITSVVIDRMLGLIGLLALLGISSLFYYGQALELGPQMDKLIHFNLLLFIGSLGFVGSLFMSPKYQLLILSLTQKIPLLGQKICKLLKQVWIIGDNKSVVLKCILISIFLQFLSLLAFYILSKPFYNIPLPLSALFTFIPIGFITIAIPISPAGLGVGHAIFDQLYQLVGIFGGANFFNLYFLCLISVNSLGIFPYLMSNKKYSFSEVEKFESNCSSN